MSSGQDEMTPGECWVGRSQGYTVGAWTPPGRAGEMCLIYLVLRTWKSGQRVEEGCLHHNDWPGLENNTQNNCSEEKLINHVHCFPEPVSAEIHTANYSYMFPIIKGMKFRVLTNHDSQGALLLIHSYRE